MSRLSSAVIRVAGREYRRLFGSKATLFLLTVFPALLFFMVAYIYQKRVVADVPIAVCDLDKTEMSRTIVRSIESTRSLKISGYLFSVEQIEDRICRGDIQGAFVIPAGLESDIKSGKQATIIVYKNTANLIIGNLILKDASNIGQTISAGILLKRLEGCGLNREQALAMANPIRIDSYPLFNPGYNYDNYLPPGIIMVMLQMLIMIIAVLVVNEEINNGTIGELLVAADKNIWAVILGKAAAHVSIYLGISVIVIGSIWIIFDIPMAGSLPAAIILLFVFILASFFVGFAVSCILNNKFIAADFAALYNSPAFLFSGYTYPLRAMPEFHYYYAQLLPFTHFMNGFVKIYGMGAPWRYMLYDLGILLIFIVCAITASAFMLKFKIQPESERSLASVEAVQ